MHGPPRAGSHGPGVVALSFSRLFLTLARALSAPTLPAFNPALTPAQAALLAEGGAAAEAAAPSIPGTGGEMGAVSSGGEEAVLLLYQLLNTSLAFKVRACGTRTLL